MRKVHDKSKVLLAGYPLLIPFTITSPSMCLQRKQILHSTFQVGKMIKNMDMIILLECLVGWLDSSHVEKKLDTIYLKLLDKCLCLGWGEYLHEHAGACERVIARILTRATNLGTLCNMLYFTCLLFQCVFLADASLAEYLQSGKSYSISIADEVIT